jgi:hypothetical protein
MDKGIRKVLNTLLTSNEFNLYYAFISGLKKNCQEKIREYVGVNYIDGQITELKLYVAFFTNDIAIESLFEFFEIKYSNELAQFYEPDGLSLDPKLGGTGVTFTLKFDLKNNSIRKGLYFLSLNDLDHLFQKTKVKSKSLFALMPYKSHLSEKKLLYFEKLNGSLAIKRIHYYSNSKTLMQHIENTYDCNFSKYTHEIEIGHDLKELDLYKFNLLMSKAALEEEYSLTKMGNKLSEFVGLLSKEEGFITVCPGFYSIGEKQSVYFLAADDITHMPVLTIENLLNRLN